MITHRDARGRIMRAAGPPHSTAKTRDEPSGRRQNAEPDHLSIRMPVAWMRALRSVAEQQQKTVTQIVLEALEPVLQPVIHGAVGLRDQPGSIGRFFGQNRKMPRIEDQVPTPITNPVPAFDHMGRWQQKQQRRKGGFETGLIDKPRR
jgi:hypothetical protein